MTDYEKIELLKLCGITNNRIVCNIIGITNKRYKHCVEVKEVMLYNGLFDVDTVYQKKWIRNCRHDIRNVYRVKEENMVEFIKANSGKFTIKELCVMMVLGNSKLPTIIMNNNLYEYVRDDKKKNYVDIKTAEKRYNSFKRNKNDYHLTYSQIADLINTNTTAIQRFSGK